jgi:type IV secretion system protein VirD4
MPPARVEPSFGLSPFESLAFWGLIAAAGAGGVLWLGTQLASLVTTGSTLDIDMTATARALVALPGTAGTPRRAWPIEHQAHLPGAAVYWGCVGVVVFVVVAMGVVAMRIAHRTSLRRHPAGVEPNAGLATARDLKCLAVGQPCAGRLTLGRVGGRMVAAEPQASLAVVGPSGCGKTVGFAIPALLEWAGPVIATSVKSDLLAATIGQRRRLGQVWVYDPTGAAQAARACWSPHDACRTWDGAMRVAAWLCEAAQARMDTVTDGDYWYTQARKALAPYLHAAAHGDRTMQDVVRWVDAEEQQEVREILLRLGGVTAALDERRRDAIRAAEACGQRADIRRQLIRQLAEHWKGHDSPEARLIGTPTAAWPHELQVKLEERVQAELIRHVDQELQDGVIAELSRAGKLDPLIAAEALWRKEDRLRGSVYATIQNALAAYADPGVGDFGTRNEIDLDAWLSGPNTIYVVAPAHEQARLRPVFSVLVQQAVRHAYDTANRSGGTLARPCLVLLDEAGNIAPLRDLPTYAATARSHGISLVTVWQDLAQLKALYDDRAQTVLNNHRAKIFGNGIADDATLEYVSRLVGDEEQRERNFSADLSGGGRRSISEHTSYRRALPLDVVRRLKPFEALLIYGSEKPACLRLRPSMQRVGS